MGSIFQAHQPKHLAVGFSTVMSLILTFVVIETPLSQAFGFAEIGLKGYAMKHVFLPSVIPLMNCTKADMDSVQKN